MKLSVEKLHPEAKLPAMAYHGDAGMDLFAAETVIIPPRERRAIKTGLKLAIPEGYAGLVWDKSGLALKHGLTCLAGVIDSNYRGEVQIVLMNHGDTSYAVEKGSKIAQVLIQPVATPEIVEETIDDTTQRGEAGFGSSGMI